MIRRVLSITILVSLILLLSRSGLRAQASQFLNENEKAGIVFEEWNQKDKRSGDSIERSMISDNTNQSDYSGLIVDEGKSEREDRIDLSPEFFEKITLRAQDISLGEAISSIAGVLGLNVVYGDRVDYKRGVSVDLSEVEVWRILNSILYPLSYSFEVIDKDLLILAVKTKSFRVFLPPVNQSFSDTTSNESYSSSRDSGNDSNDAAQNIKVGTKITVERQIELLSFWNDIEDNLEKIISESGEYMVNRSAGIVTVTDSPLILDKAKDYLALVNELISQQVRVDVKVVEVTLKDQRSQGVDWNIIQERIASGSNLSLASNFSPLGLGNAGMMAFNITEPQSGSLTTGGVNAVIKALREQGSLEIVSQPQLTMLNNQVAVIQVGTTTSYVNQSNTETIQSVGTITSMNIDQVHQGVTMRLCANIVGEDIYLSISPVVTTVDAIREISAGGAKIEAPQTTTKSINTMVKAKNNRTVVIGGLISQEKQKTDKGIPILSKIPIFGFLFGYKSKMENKTELVIFITPKVV